MTVHLRNELLKMSGALLETPQIRVSAGHLELFDPVFNLLYHCVKLAPQSHHIRKLRQKLLIHLLKPGLPAPAVAVFLQRGQALAQLFQMAEAALSKGHRAADRAYGAHAAALAGQMRLGVPAIALRWDRFQRLLQMHCVVVDVLQAMKQAHCRSPSRTLGAVHFIAFGRVVAGASASRQSGFALALTGHDLNIAPLAISLRVVRIVAHAILVTYLTRNLPHGRLALL